MGMNVVWAAAPGAHPVLVGSVRLTGWTEVAGASDIWVAQGPKGIQTRQLYVAGTRATRATGPVPDAATLAGWKDPSGGTPAEVEFVYTGGFGAWTEARCPVASATPAAITMAQPCWDNSTKRGNNQVGPGTIGAPTRAENAYQLLDAPGEWYLDQASSKFYYIPLTGQTLSTLDVEAPVLESLVTGGGTAAQPLQHVIFQGIQFSYATWLGASGPNGFSEVQANYLVWGTAGPTAANDTFAWYQIPANVSLTYDQNIQFKSDVFVHLGGAGIGLGNGSQNDVIDGCVVTDTSGNGIELGNVDLPTATGAAQTLGNTISDNHVFATPVEFHGGVAIDVGYSAMTRVIHNQVDHTSYSGMSIGWGGWPDKSGKPGITNYGHSSDISNNLLFNVMQNLQDGGGIYMNGQTSADHSFATGQTVKGNVIHDDSAFGWALYTDNGSDWVTLTGNAVWNASGTFGYCHNDTYPDEGGGLDNTIVQNNYLSNAQPSGPGTGTDLAMPHCQVSGNTPASKQADVPAAILSAAGLEPSYQALLDWQQVAPPQ